MKPLLSSLVLLYISLSTVSAQVSVTNLPATVYENFNTLASSGTSSSLPLGWEFLETGTNANTTYTAGTGSLTTGDTYSFGLASATERALGQIRSSSLNSTIAASFVNNTGKTITTIAITYRGEQWRIGTIGRVDKLIFSYTENFTSLSGSTWTNNTSGDFTAPNTTSTLGALDGNLTANNTIVSFTISGLNIPNGQSFGIRWTDFDASGADDGLAIDDFSATFSNSTAPCSTPAAQPTNLAFSNITETTISGSFDYSGAESYIVVATQNQVLTSNPVNQVTYAVGDPLGDGTVVSVGNSNTFTATSLVPGTPYNFFVFAVSSTCNDGPVYLTTSPLSASATTVSSLPNCAAPSTQPTNLNFSSSTVNSIQGSFTPSIANQFLILVSASSTLTAMPANGINYNMGDAIGNATVVQNNDQSTFTATGLSGFTTYYFFVFANNSQDCINGPAYNTASPLTGSYATLAMQACTIPTSSPSGLQLSATTTSIVGSFSPSLGADSYLVVQSTSPTLSSNPVNGTNYTAGNSLGGGTVIGTFTSTSFTSGSLTPNTTYYYFVFAANTLCSGGSKYNTSPLTGNATTIAVAQNNFYFGNLHAHSDYSDGNKDTPGYTPEMDYSYAKNSSCMDFLGISEHNHYSSNNNPGNLITNYHLGITQADNFSAANPGFLALYGMEWGVISGGGHVLVYGDGMNKLYGWESNVGGITGPNYDTYVAKSDYTGTNGLFKTIYNDRSYKTFAILAHPNSTDFNNLAGVAYSAIADSAIVGSCVESGPAFSTNTSYSDPGSSMSDIGYYRTLLAKGYKLGPTIDHDNHNLTFGRTAYTRTAVIAPALTKSAIINAVKNMHFYSTQDCDYKVDYKINSYIMGSTITAVGAPVLTLTITDNTTSAANSDIKVMRGVPGSGVLATQVYRVTGTSFVWQDNSIANLSTAYYYLDITNGTKRVLTSPIWYTRNDAVVPVDFLFFNAYKTTLGISLDWATAQENNTDKYVIEKSADGRNWNFFTQVNAIGFSSIRTNYNTADLLPFAGKNYYRIKQIDRDGKYTYSIVRMVNYEPDITFDVFPNPASDFIKVKVEGGPTENIISLTDVSGRIIATGIFKEAENSFKVKNLANGIYFIKVENGKNIYTKKIVVLH